MPRAFGNSSHTMAGTTDHEKPPKAPPRDDGGAIDDSEDADEDFVNLQKTTSESRRRQKENTSSEDRLQEALPFQFLPNLRPLTISDVGSCVALEDSAFEKEHRCSKEKFEYRLSACPELSLGVFCSVVPSELKDFDLCTLKTAHPVETGRDNGAVSVLLAHIIGTRCTTEVVTDISMDYPKGFRTTKNTTELGHQEAGRTVAIHSLAVHPKLQARGLGKLIMKAYLQQINNSDLADRMSLICQDYLVEYYARFGFKHLGPSKAQFGGGGWNDMTFELPGPPKTGPSMASYDDGAGPPRP